MGPDHSMVWRFFAICAGVLGFVWLDLALRGDVVNGKHLLFALAWMGVAVAYLIVGHRKKKEEIAAEKAESAELSGQDSTNY